MKRILNIISIVAILVIAFANNAYAQNCDVPVSVMIINAEDMDASSADILKNRLSDVVSKQGLIANLDYSQFFVGAKINVLDKQIVNGPPAQVVTNYGLNIYVADYNNQKIFSSVYLELKGVGQNQIKSLNSALSKVTPANAKITSAIDQGKKQIVQYFNAKYKEILAKADRAAKLNKHAEAVALCASIPECSVGGQEATKKAMEYYEKYRDELNTYLLNEAKAAWVGSQNEEGAMYAAELLSGVDPKSSSYGAAQKLMSEIQGQIRKDIDFENKEKYNTEVGVEKLRIDAVKAVGVAYGNGQQPSTTNLAWVR